jgi:hypothetical protein
LSYEPTEFDIEWLKAVVSLLNVGGVWAAPMGFTFRKTGENRLELVNVQGQKAREMVRRTVVAGRKAGIEVIVKDDAPLP